VISPCVAFNNHPGSTKSFDYVREHNEAVNALDVMIPREEIVVDHEPGSVIDVTQHDGSVLRLRKLAANYDPTNRQTAMAHLQERQAAGEVVTGLLYVNDASGDMNDRLNTVDAPLNSLGEAELCPGSAAIDAINASLR
jgi:2-oxoglutarate ferredoxin oxidoreductase subunit beta